MTLISVMREPAAAAASNSRGSTSLASSREQHGLVLLDVDLARRRSTSRQRSAMPSRSWSTRASTRALLADDLHELLVRADGDHLAVVDDADAVAELLRLGHVVRGVEDRHALVAQREDAVEDRAPALRVDAHRRLVEVEHLGLVQQRDADVDAPLHAAAELVDAVLLAVDEGDELEHLVDPLLERRRPTSPYILPQNTRFSRALMSGYRAMSCGTTPMASLTACGVADDGVAGDDGVAAAGLQQAGEHGDGGALAGAVGAEQAEDLALVDVEADAVDGQHALGRVVLLAQLLDLDDAHRPPSP